MPGQTIRGSRIAPQDPSQLDGLVGTYYSPELETSYTLLRSGDRLVARHQRHEDIELVPVSNDELAGGQWFFARLMVEREGTAVTGIRVSGGRVQGLHFERRP